MLLPGRSERKVVIIKNIFHGEIRYFFFVKNNYGYLAAYQAFYIAEVNRIKP